MSLLPVSALYSARAQCDGALLGLHWYARWSWMSGVQGPDPRLPATHRAYRLCRLRLMCYSRHLQAQGRPGIRLPAWRLPRHPVTPRRASAGWQQSLAFIDSL